VVRRRGQRGSDANLRFDRLTRSSGDDVELRTHLFEGVDAVGTRPPLHLDHEAHQQRAALAARAAAGEAARQQLANLVLVAAPGFHPRVGEQHPREVHDLGLDLRQRHIERPLQPSNRLARAAAPDPRVGQTAPIHQDEVVVAEVEREVRRLLGERDRRVEPPQIDSVHDHLRERDLLKAEAAARFTAAVRTSSRIAPASSYDTRRATACTASRPAP
jgi:hypothetical protein